MLATPEKRAALYRMVTPQHICPFGLKSKALLKSQGYAVDDNWLTTREATDAFKAKWGVDTTPQTFIGGARIGGYDDLRRHFGKAVRDPKQKTYAPVFAVFGSAAVLAAATAFAAGGPDPVMQGVQWFAAFSMVLLAVQKLRDVETFTNMLLGYDLLAQRVVPYAYAYPFLELLVGVLMAAGALPWLAGPLALLLGGVGAVSVIKAVYIDKRELRCACTGGGSNVPLGALSLAENGLMIAMGVWALLGMG